MHKYKVGRTLTYVKAEGLSPVKTIPLGSKVIITSIGPTSITKGRSFYTVIVPSSGVVRSDIHEDELQEGSIIKRDIPWL